MGLFNWNKKKEELFNNSSNGILPEPPSIEKATLPPLPKEKSETKLRFPKIPFKVSKNYEERAFALEKKRFDQREMLDVIQPLFIQGTQFRDIVLDLTESKNELKKASDFAENFEEIHGLKEIKFEELRENIETMQRKLIFMDKTLFK